MIEKETGSAKLSKKGVVFKGFPHIELLYPLKDSQITTITFGLGPGDPAYALNITAVPAKIGRQNGIRRLYFGLIISSMPELQTAEERLKRIQRKIGLIVAAFTECITPTKRILPDPAENAKPSKQKRRDEPHCPRRTRTSARSPADGSARNTILTIRRISHVPAINTSKMRSTG